MARPPKAKEDDIFALAAAAELAAQGVTATPVPVSDEEAKAAAQALAPSVQVVVDEIDVKPQGTGKKGPDISHWMPPLTEGGKKLWRCRKKYILLHSERGSGKTSDALHYLVRHAYQNDGAAVCIVTKERSGLTDGGPWSKLFEYVLPAWQEGFTNWDGVFSAGFGLRGEGKNGEIVMHTDNSKNLWFWIQNQHGGMSKIFTRSLQHGEQVVAKIRTVEFTAYYHEELTLVDDEEYFTKPIQQLFRKAGKYERFFLAACNPPENGEDHWVYKRWFTGMDATPTDEDPNPKRSEDYEAIHFPATGNIFMSPELRKANWASIMEEARNDPTAEDRLIRGIWRKKPTGKGIFRDYWNRDLHVAGVWVPGKPDESMIIVPDPNRTIEVGYDPGAKNFAISLEQRRRAPHGEGWIVFDEIAPTGIRRTEEQVAIALLDAMEYWCRRCNAPLRFNHISDAAGFNNADSQGNTDIMRLEREVKRLMRENAKWPWLAQTMVIRGEIDYRVYPCPKSADSVSGRVKMAVQRMQMRLLKISAKCEKTIEMCGSLDRIKDGQPFQPDAKSPHKHIFDSMTYPMWHHELGGEIKAPLVLRATFNSVGN